MSAIGLRTVGKVVGWSVAVVGGILFAGPGLSSEPAISLWWGEVGLATLLTGLGVVVAASIRRRS